MARPAGDAPHHGGLPPPRVDQVHRPPPQQATTPSNAGTLRARLVILSGGAGSGLFDYSPTPGPGNLIGSWTPAAGVDDFGNVYPAGLTSEQGSIAGSVITGSSFQGFNFVIDNQGIRIYQAPNPVTSQPPPPPAAPVPYLVASRAVNTAASQTIAVTTATAAGDFLHLAANCSPTGGGATVTAVGPDTAGNVWTEQANDATQIQTSVWTSPGTHALATTDTIPVTYSSGNGQKNMSVCAVRGLPASPLDVSVAAAGNDISPMVTSGALAEANELALVVISNGNGGGVPTLGTGLVLLDQQVHNNTQYLTVAYEDITSAAGITAGGGLAAAVPWAATITTLKET